MSYSRWGANSFWYTFYCVTEGLNRDDQIFEVCGVASFTYGDLKRDIEACLDKAVKESGNEVGTAEDGCTVMPADGRPGPTPDDREELRGYMQTFMQDVEEDEDIECWERLKDGRFAFVPNINAWLTDYRERMTQTFNGKTMVRNEGTLEAIQEAIDVLKAPDDELPAIMSTLKTDLGKRLVEKRMMTCGGVH